MSYRYDTPTKPCATKPGVGVVSFRDAMLPLIPPGYDLGILNCRPIAGSNKLSEHGKGWAWDIGFRPFCHPMGWEFFNWCVKRRNEIGMQYIAWCGKSCRGPNQKDFVHPYGGTLGDHADHVHIAFNAAAAADSGFGRRAKALWIQDHQGGDDMANEGPQILQLLGDLRKQLDWAPPQGRGTIQKIDDLHGNIEEVRTRLKKIEDKLASGSGGGSVDLDVLATRVADKLAERLKA